MTNTALQTAKAATRREAFTFAPTLPVATLARVAHMSGVYKHLCLRRLDWAKHAYYEA